jgi:hypothetical protein
MWHIPEEGCKLTVKGDVNDVLTVSCNLGDDAMDYHCAVSQRGLLMMFVKGMDETTRYYDGANAVSILKQDLVWETLPETFRSMVKASAASLTKRR